MNLSQNALMLYATYELLTVASAVVISQLLRHELRANVSLTRQWRWVVAGMVLQLIGVTLYRHLGATVLSDFYLHALGGGIICLCLFYYVIRTFSFRFLSWRLELMAFFMFVSTFGVLNEMMEFALQSLGYGNFSTSSLDTWHDLAANSVGAVVLWAVFRMGLRLHRNTRVL